MDDEVFTVKEVAEMFKLSPSTIYARVSGWPHLRITPTDIRFSRGDIEAIKAMSRKTPVPPPVMGARSTRIGTERQKARNRAYNLRNGLRERPLS
ncbi:helix-turn-helix domain-containing protein [Arthrobacter sp. IA7]|uniref:helix-turn-helix transcriptional regulator n=1 Tax=Arthrobacter ipis TaxID=2716202 RepID=UPI001683E7D8|nr:helix-turn-helix domain-containing protein [Arthrobacter ipis]MBD1540998.1 helix-turn-helix domain-containing protein [Arthrobacter ipis]